MKRMLVNATQSEERRLASQYETLPGFTHGAGDMWTDPRLTDETAYTAAAMILQPTSPAVGAGANTGLSTDFWYRPRSGAMDLGAL